MAYAIGVLLEHNLRGVYHVTNRGACSWYQFALKILELAHIEGTKVRPVSSDICNRPAKRPAYSILNRSKFEKETGLTLRFWEDALAELFEAIRQGFDPPIKKIFLTVP